MSVLDEIELPIIQAPMASSSDSELAIAVCRAGGLGSLPCAMLSTEQIRREVESIRNVVDAPFNLNFFCHRPEPLTEAADLRWRERLAPYYEEMGLKPDASPASGGRSSFDAGMTKLVRELAPAVVSFHFGLPESSLVEQVKAAGAFVLSSATTIEEARWLAEHGADAVIAQGVGAGGHRGHFLQGDLDGQSSVDAHSHTMDLLTAILDEVTLPVIAAGGISTRTAVEQALAAGATAVQVGTAFLLCPESRTSEIHRHALKSVAAKETAVTNVFTGRPARGIVNRIMRELGPICDDAPPFPYAVAAIAPLRREAEKEGNSDFSPLWCGIEASGCEEISALEMTRRLGTGH